MKYVKIIYLLFFIILLSTEAKAEDDVFFKVYVDNDTPIEQSEVIYTVKLFDSVGILKSIVSPPKINNLTLYPLNKDKRYVEEYNGKEYLVLEWKYAFFPNKSGVLEITPPTFEGEINYGFISGTPQFYNRKGQLTKNPFRTMKFSSRLKTSFPAEIIQLQVQPLAEKVIVAKDVSVSDSWQPSSDEVNKGEAINRSIKLDFTGFNPSLFQDFTIESTDEIKVYEGKVLKKSFARGEELLFNVTMSFTYVPNNIGLFTVPSFKIKWFNSVTKSIEYSTLPSRIIKVKGESNSLEAKLPAQEREDNRSFYEDMKIYKWFNLLDSEALLNSLAVVFFLLLLYIRIRQRIKRSKRNDKSK